MSNTLVNESLCRVQSHQMLDIYPTEHERGLFAPAFDRLVMVCLTGVLDPPPFPAIGRSIKRHGEVTAARPAPGLKG